MVVKTSSQIDQFKSYRMEVERGAFHHDRFIVSFNMIEYLPDSTYSHQEERFNIPSKTNLDATVMLGFFKKMEEEGFWKLENHYATTSSCASEFRITLKGKDKSKTVICEDLDRDCPDLIKYIDKKIVELEGNRLDRIYFPG